MTDLHLEALDDLEVLEVVEQGLASLHARLTDENDLASRDQRALIESVCDSFDELAAAIRAEEAP